MGDHSSEIDVDPLLIRLVGSQMSAVVFVRDYMQLQFDGPLITITANVITRIAEKVFGMQDLGFRDALVSHIGHRVTGASVHKGEAISIKLSEDREIRISLRDEDRDWRPEAAVLTFPRGPWNTYP
jgi:hypothetical protein